MKTLIYTIAFDPSGVDVYSDMARLLILSLRRSGCDYDIVVFTNNSNGIFRNGKYNLTEVYCDTKGLSDRQITTQAKCLKFSANEFIHGEKYDHIVYLDCDCLIINDINKLLESDKMITSSVESWGKISDNPFRAYLSDTEMTELQHPPINSGVFRISGKFFNEIAMEWKRIYHSTRIRTSGCEDQPSWVRVFLDKGDQADYWEISKFVRYPLAERIHQAKARDNAIVLHYLGLPASDRLTYMIADYFRIYESSFLGNCCRLLEN